MVEKLVVSVIMPNTINKMINECILKNFLKIKQRMDYVLREWSRYN